MSGVEERPADIPKCVCLSILGWVVRQTIDRKFGSLLVVNTNNDAIRWYGKWNRIGNTKEYILERASYMECGGCGRTASHEDFLKLLRLFKREN